jgi:hypothetical protein
MSADRDQVHASSDIHELVEALRRDAATDLDVALGFEAPLFLPVPQEPTELGRARSGEGSRPYCGGAGPTVTVLGIQQTAWVLRAVAEAFQSHAVTTEWRGWRGRDDRPRLLLWEAFVTAGAKSPTHQGDAATAALAFIQNEGALADANAVSATTPLSLIGAVALWAGLPIDAQLLRAPVLVLKPGRPFPWLGPA